MDSNIYDGTIYSNPDPAVEYYCYSNVKSAGFNLLMKLSLLTREYREAEVYIKNLIKKNINQYDTINKKNDKGWTALMLAVANINRYSTENTIKILLEAGADSNVKNNNGSTALMLATVIAGYDSKNIINMLIGYGSDINSQDSYGFTALMLCITNNRFCTEKIVMTLLEAGANVNIQDKNGNTALMLAIKCNASVNMENIIKLLLNKADINICNTNGETALLIALENQSGNKEKIIDLLMSKKIIIDHNALIYAAKWNKGSINLFNKLLGKGATVNNSVRDNDKKYELIKTIIQNNDIKLAEIYIAENGDLDCELFKYINDKQLYNYLKPFIIKREYYKLLHKTIITDIKKYITNKELMNKKNSFKLTQNMEIDYLK
jgi:hypothetical protein